MYSTAWTISSPQSLGEVRTIFGVRSQADSDDKVFLRYLNRVVLGLRPDRSVALGLSQMDESDNSGASDQCVVVVMQLLGSLQNFILEFIAQYTTGSDTSCALVPRRTQIIWALLVTAK